MIPPFIHGSIAPVFTAFNEDGTLDDDGQRNLLDFLQSSNAISAYFIRSGMGQMYTFSYEDVQQISRTACTHMPAEAPVLVGTTGIWDRDRSRLPDPAVFTRQAAELSQFAEEQGAAAVVHTMPEAIAPGPGETTADVVLRYFETIANATSLPVLIYQAPGTAPEYQVTIDLVRRLADMPAIQGMKASTTDAEYILDLTWAVRDKDFGFIAGAETAFYAALGSGAKACIGQGTSINPAIINAVQDRFDQKDYDGAIEAQRTVNELVQISVNPVGFFKRYATEKGFPVPLHVRPMAKAVYGKESPAPLADGEYNAFKNRLETELERFRCP